MNEKFSPRQLGSVEIAPNALFTKADVKAVIDGMKRRQSIVETEFEHAKNAGTLHVKRGQSLVQWRCRARGHLLLDVFEVPDIGLCAWQFGYRLGPKDFERYGQQLRDRFPDGRLPARKDTLLPDDLQYWLNCEHVHGFVVTGKEARQGAERHAGVIIVP